MKQNGNSHALKWVWNVSGNAKLWPVLQTLIRISQGCISILYAHSLGAVVDGAASGNMQTFSGHFNCLPCTILLPSGCCC